MEAILHQDEPVITQRIVGTYTQNNAGPIALFVGGLHGNEPAGLIALQYVLSSLKEINPGFKGRLIALAGNLPALEQKQRFINADLNRNWHLFLKEFKKNQINSSSKDVEFEERTELLKKILATLKSSDDHVYFFDLHTTSAESIPFLSISDTMRNRKLVKRVPVPIILGLSELIDGTLGSVLNDMGIPSVIFEAGQHDDLSSIENHIAFIWLMLERLGCIKARHIPGFDKHRNLLKRTSIDKRRIFEVFFRHVITEEDKFKMNPGFVNFEKVKKGQVLAKDVNGLIKAHKKGRVFMPLYQGLGDDGFFVVREVNAIWLRISKALRKLKADNILKLLPGVSEYPQLEKTLIVNKHIALVYALQLFHLFGYRRIRKENGIILVSRLKYDTQSPSNIEILENIDSYMRSSNF